MVDLANIYYPRIFDLAHRFFEACWPSVCGQDYPHVVQERKLGFPVVQVTSEFLNPLRYGDLICSNHPQLTWFKLRRLEVPLQESTRC